MSKRITSSMILATGLRRSCLDVSLPALLMAVALSAQGELRVLCEIPFYDVSQLLEAGGVSRDGSVIVQGGTSLYGEEVYIQVWDGKTGLRMQTIPTKKVAALAVAPDGKVLVASDGGTRIRMWNCKSGRRIRDLIGHRGEVVALTFSPDGSKVASSAEDNTVRIWHANRGTLLATLSRTSPCLRLEFSPDSMLLAGCETNGRITVWQVGKVEPVACFPEKPAPGVSCLGFAPDGESVYCGRGTSLARYRVKTGELMSKREFPVAGARLVRVSPDGRTVLSLAPPGSITAWTVDRAQKIKDLLPHRALVQDIAFSGDGRWVVSFSKPGYGRLFDTKTFEPPSTMHTWWNRGSALAYSHKGRVLAAGSGSGEVLLWHTKKGQVIRRFAGHPSPVSDLRFSPDDKALVSSDQDGEVCVWSCGGGALLRRIESRGRTCGFALIREGSMLLVAWDGGNILRYDMKTGKQVGAIPAPKSPMVRMVVAPDTRVMAVSSKDGQIFVVDLHTEAELARFRMMGKESADSLAFDWQRRYLAASAYNDRVVVWSLKSKRVVFEHKAKAFGSLLYLRGKSAFVSPIVGGSVKMWRVPGGEGQTCFTVPGLASFALAASSDGRQLATALGDGSLRTIDIR